MLKKTWFRIMFSLLMGGMITEFIDIMSVASTEPSHLPLIIAAIFYFFITYFVNKNY